MGAYIDAFMHATAWAMEKPTPYGAFHLAYTFVWLVCGHGFVYPGR